MEKIKKVFEIYNDKISNKFEIIEYTSEYIIVQIKQSFGFMPVFFRIFIEDDEIVMQMQDKRNFDYYMKRSLNFRNNDKGLEEMLVYLIDVFS